MTERRVQQTLRNNFRIDREYYRAMDINHKRLIRYNATIDRRKYNATSSNDLPQKLTGSETLDLEPYPAERESTCRIFLVNVPPSPLT
jgi:hypothetical protein